MIADLLFVVYFLALISPGLVMGIRMHCTGLIAKPFDAILLGYVLGYALAILSQTAMMYIQMPMWITPTLFGLSWLYLLVPSTGSELSFEWWSVWTENKIAWVCGLVAVTFASIVLMYFGMNDGGTKVYSTLFVNDYFNHIAVSAELAKNVPPTNIYYQGGLAHYYWFFHVIPGSFHRLMGFATHMPNLLGLLVKINIIFVFGLWWRLFLSTGAPRKAAGAGLLLILAAYSYIDLFLIGRAIGNSIGISSLVPQLESVWPRIQQFSGLSHSYIRDFFMEPHAVSSMVFAVAAILVHTGTIGKFSKFVKGIILGLFVLCSFGCDSFMGTILALWIAIDTALDLLKSDDKKSYISLVSGVGLVAMVGVFYVFGMDMIGGQGGMLSFKPMKNIIAVLPFYLTLDYGPIFILGIAGWWLAWRKKIKFPSRRIWLMAVIALGFGLLIQHAVEPDILLRKSGKPLQLVLLVGAVIFLGRVLQSKGWGKKIAIGLMALAMPSLAFDLNAFAFGGREMANKISVHEYNALRWISQNTEPDAVVQGIPGWHGQYKYDVNPIPALAERPVAVGTFMLAALWGVGPGPAMERIGEVEKMFNADSISQVTLIMDKLNIDYLYLGPHEREKFKLRSELFVENDSLFDVVYNRNDITVLHYRQRND